MHRQLNFENVPDKFNNPYAFNSNPPMADAHESSSTAARIAPRTFAAQSRSASQEALKPGAYVLTGNRFLSSQLIFQILFSPDVAERAI